MKKSISFMLCIVMILTCLPMVSWAAEDSTVTLDVGLGRIVITADGYRIYGDKTDHAILEKTHRGSYLLTGTADANCVGDGQSYVTVENTTGVAITMKDLKIVIPEATSAAAFTVGSVVSNKVTVDLTLEGTNVLTSGKNNDGFTMPNRSVLNIDGTGSLTCTGGSGNEDGFGIYGESINVSGGTVQAFSGEIEATTDDPTDHYIGNCGLWAGNHLIVSGTGSVTGKAGAVKGVNVLSYGIACYADITVTGEGSISGEGGRTEGSMSSYSAGIDASEITAIGSVSLSAKGGSADSQNKSATSLGLRTNRVTASDNAKIEAMGETAASRTEGVSIGASVYGDIELKSGATMSAVAGSVQSKSPEGEAESYGLEARHGSVDLSGGAKLTASGGPVYGSNASSFSIGAKILEEDLTISDGYVAVRGYGKKSDSDADVDQANSFGLDLQGKLTVGEDGKVSATGGDATVTSCGIRCGEAQVDGIIVSDTKQAPREIGMDVTGEMVVGKTGDVQAYLSNASSESYMLAVGKPMIIDGGFVIAVGYMKDDGSQGNTTNAAVYYYGGTESDPAVVLKNEATLWAYCFYDTDEDVQDVKKGIAVNGEVDLSAYGDYCWKSDKTEGKYRWDNGAENPRLSEDDVELLMIQSYVPTNLRPNGGTVELTQVCFGPDDTADDLPTPERSGYTFLGWYTEPEGGIRVDSDFVFDEEWTLYAHWKKKSSSSSGSSSGGSTIDQPVEPDPSVDETGDSDADCDHGSDCPLNQFDDVNGDAWYRDGIDFCVTNGLMSGTGDKTFAPDRTASRAMLVTILYQLEGRPEAGDYSFMDVNDGTWYFDAVSWAADFGIAGGIGNDRFAPDQALTREQLAVILYQYAKYKGYDVFVDGEADLDFADSADVSGWAQTALKWAVQNKLINGVGSDRLSPKGQATRAQLATILYQFCQIFVQNVTK